MAAGTTPIFGDTVVQEFVTVVNADGTNKKTVHTGGTDGTRVLSVSVTSDDTAAVRLNVYITSGGTDYQIGQVTIPIGAGTGTSDTASVNLLDATKMPFLQSDGSLLLENGSVLKVAANSAVTAAKTVTLVSYALDY